ncbi:hypothetical protein [Methylocaldum szegediense]|uniref:Uncharacterized protein n=1 Tax=Methylocaldum szegediense TaxID=73780 RepID=A0ABN8X7V1_9GAMM|nr:hypothetical protein [Methylocaldum szegediense]CAI8850224.1 conserved protein of unknown function [Methylocaldum szegediense]
MSANLWQEDPIEDFSFSVSYEGLGGLLIDLDLYVFNRAGELIDCQPIWNGKTSVALSAQELSEARFMIAPPIRASIRKPIMKDMIRDFQGFEVGFNFAPENRSVTLSVVPQAVWRAWQRTGSLNKRRKAHNLSDDFLIW